MIASRTDSRSDAAVGRFQQIAASIASEVASVIVGQHEVLRGVLIALFAGGHVLLEGVPGVGKTRLVRTLAGTLALRYQRIQFTPDLMPADITGTNIIAEDESGERRFRFEPGPIFSNVVLADEINRATPKTQSALLEAMQEQQVTIATQIHRLSAPFMVLATQNPIEMEGTYPLPEAQLDRFLFKLRVTVPTTEELVTILDRTTSEQEHEVRRVATGDQVLRLQELVREVPIAQHVLQYVARLVQATDPQQADAPRITQEYVRYGSSPRGAQALVLAGKVNALIEGRYNVSFEDVRAVAHQSLRHRIILSFEAEAEGVTGDDIIDQLVIAVIPDELAV
ncbi:MAG: AAA family ATPase [Dehalococcoidia bacterium]|nr:AAA family ATPase [Dehalococcoidia bacterium]